MREERETSWNYCSQNARQLSPTSWRYVKGSMKTPYAYEDILRAAYNLPFFHCISSGGSNEIRGRGGKRERSPRHMAKRDVYPRVTHDRRILHSLVWCNVNSVLIVNALYLWLYDARHARNFVHPGTREKASLLFNMRLCRSYVYTWDTHSILEAQPKKKK